MGAFIIFVIGLVFILHIISADTVPSQNVTRSFNFSPIPVSTKLIARTKVPLFMNSRGSYTVTKILEETNTTSAVTLQSSSPVTLVTFAPFTKSFNYSTLAKTTAAGKTSKMNKIAKALKTSPTLLVASVTTTSVPITTSRMITNKPTTTSTNTDKTVTVTKDTAKKNKLSMSKLAIMAATLTADTTTGKISVNATERKATTTKPTKPKKDKTKNPKNKHAKHQSTSPKPKKSKYSKKKTSTRKTKSKNTRSKSNKTTKRKNKNGKNKNGKRHTHTRKYRQTDDFSGCHPYWNPKPNCDVNIGQSSSQPPFTAQQRVVKRRVRSQRNTLALQAFNTLKKVNTYFKMF